MKGPCATKFCEKSSARHCSFFTEVKRRKIFDLFWKMCWNEKKYFSLIVLNIQCSNTKLYHLRHCQIRKQVCNKMFVSTLGISENTARIWAQDQDNSERSGHSYEKEVKSFNTTNKKLF